MLILTAALLAVTATGPAGHKHHKAHATSSSYFIDPIQMEKAEKTRGAKAISESIKSYETSRFSAFEADAIAKVHRDLDDESISVDVLEADWKDLVTLHRILVARELTLRCGLL